MDRKQICGLTLLSLGVVLILLALRSLNILHEADGQVQAYARTLGRPPSEVEGEVRYRIFVEQKAIELSPSQVQLTLYGGITLIILGGAIAVLLQK